MIESCETLVIGSGAGGALTASYLAKQGKDVLLVEEGPHVRLEGEKCNVTHTMPLVWRNGGFIPILGNTPLVFGEGCCFGGSTMLNSGLMHRIPHAILEEWEREFAFYIPEGIDLYHEKIEKELNVQTVDQSDNPAYRLFKGGADQMNLQGMDVPCAWKENWTKNNMQTTFLAKATQHGCRFLTRCRIDRIKTKGGRAFCVTGRVGLKPISIQFKTLYICAGAIQTPLLLRKSGFKENIGNSIQFHPTLRVTAEYPEPLYLHEHLMPFFQVKSPPVTFGASVSLPPFLASGLAPLWMQQAPLSIHQLATYYVCIRPESRGIVRALGSRQALIRFSLSKNDLHNLQRGTESLMQLLFAAGFTTLFPQIKTIPAIKEFKKITMKPREMKLMTIHAFSSCPAGENRKRCPVNPFGQLYACPNIYIHDASILPSSPGVNPQGPLMALVLRSLIEKQASQEDQ